MKTELKQLISKVKKESWPSETERTDVSSVCRQACPTLTVLCSHREIYSQSYTSIWILNFIYLKHSITLFICTALFFHSDAFKCLVFPPHLCLRLMKLAREQKPTVTIIRSTDETHHINSAFKIYTGPHEVYRGTLRGTCSYSLKFLQRLVINAASTEGHGSVNQYWYLQEDLLQSLYWLQGQWISK